MLLQHPEFELLSRFPDSPQRRCGCKFSAVSHNSSDSASKAVQVAVICPDSHASPPSLRTVPNIFSKRSKPKLSWTRRWFSAWLPPRSTIAAQEPCLKGECREEQSREKAEPKPNPPQAAPAQWLSREQMYDELNRRLKTFLGMHKVCSAPICKRMRRCLHPTYQCERDFPDAADDRGGEGAGVFQVPEAARCGYRAPQGAGPVARRRTEHRAVGRSFCWRQRAYARALSL